MAASDVSFTQDGGNVRVHPYVVALVRWCVSCLWSAATVLLHRLMTAKLQRPSITASKAGGPPTPRPSPRPASSTHIHPEPLVQCQVLHQPSKTDVDFVFVHGLYGSLENTWRQGDWRSKYKIGPNRIPLKRSNSIPTPCICDGCTCNDRLCCTTNDNNIKKTKRSCSASSIKMYNEQTYFETNLKMLPNDQMFITDKIYNNTLLNQVNIVDNFEMQAQFVRELFEKNICERDGLICDDDKSELKDSEPKNVDNNDCICDFECDVGCGCICDKCYSPCWPKDWLQVDFPNARVISVNYTSDPYLWRPLWVKECKRLRLHERAEQMTQQLLALGVGRKPIVWVGHSKGGLFIKQIYCEAYEAHLKTTLDKQETETGKGNTNPTDENHNQPNESQNEKPDTIFISTNNKNTNDTEYSTKLRAGLWCNSSGFMFYSVPHRGSPLADIKTPITARSIELLEISKDNSLVLSLHGRWLAATAPAAPLVRSLVETSRTLMAVLWLRIVSVESADAGIGALCGISVDHREICKPSSRGCVLYTELLNLARAAIDRANNGASSRAIDNASNESKSL